MEFHLFDADYVQRLAAGDPATESHFSAYFQRFLFLKLRSRLVSPELAEDVRQETLYRVLKALRHGSGVAQPEAFGAFVNAVCNHVLLEFAHRESRYTGGEDNAPEPRDDHVDLDAPLITEDRRRMVGMVLDALPAKDREILYLLYFEELDRHEVSARLGVDAGYLRVLLHRAKGKFLELYQRKHGAAGHALAFWLACNALAAGATISRGPN